MTTKKCDSKETNHKESLLQILPGTVPRSNGVTEEQEIFHNSGGVHSDHVANASESTVFLFIVTNVSQRKTPTKEAQNTKTSICEILEVKRGTAWLV